MSEFEFEIPRCPTCGALPNEDTLQDRVDVRCVETDFGLSIRWREIHLCPDCGGLWSFEDSDV